MFRGKNWLIKLATTEFSLRSVKDCSLTAVKSLKIANSLYMELHSNSYSLLKGCYCSLKSSIDTCVVA
jgi:hypothetical protein